MDSDQGVMTAPEPVVDDVQKPAKSAPAARKPHTLDLVVDAITQNPDRKGVSVTAIKSHLAKQDPSLPANVIKNRLRKALDKGFGLNLIVRPKGSEITGVSLSGRFLVNKDTLKAIRKTKPGETKSTKHSSTDDDMPPKKVAKTVKKTTTTNKENVAKTANKAVKAKPKVVKKATTKPTTVSTKAKEVVKAAKKTATTKTTKAKVVKAKVTKPKPATTTKAKTATAKKTTTKVLATKNKMPGTPKITQPRKPRAM